MMSDCGGLQSTYVKDTCEIEGVQYRCSRKLSTKFDREFQKTGGGEDRK